MEIYNLLDKMEFVEEVATLEYNEWADEKEKDRVNRISKKILKIKSCLSDNDFCKLILVDDDELIGFISIFPSDCDECMDLSPWYATMYVKEEYRGRGYSRLLNDAVLEEARRRGFGEIYLKTNLVGYYEKFGAEFVRELSEGEKVFRFELVR